MRFKAVLRIICLLLLASYSIDSFGQDSDYKETALEIESLTPNMTSPQSPESSIKWTATVSNPGGFDLEYKFNLLGPRTNGKIQLMRLWSSDNTWIWKTNEKDIGNNKIIVEIRDRSPASKDGSHALTIEEILLDAKFEIDDQTTISSIENKQRDPINDTTEDLHPINQPIDSLPSNDGPGNSNQSDSITPPIEQDNIIKDNIWIFVVISSICAILGLIFGPGNIYKWCKSRQKTAAVKNKGTTNNINASGGIAPRVSKNFSNEYLEILKAIQAKSPTSHVQVFPLVMDIGITEDELGDLLDLMANEGLIQVERGTNSPGITLPNGIHSVCLTAQGRQLLKEAM